MVTFLSRLFNIRAREWPRLLILYSMAFLFIAGMTWGETVAEASFLHLIGVEYLPIVFIINTLISIVIVAIYTAFVDRISDQALLIGISILSGLAIIAGRVLIGAELFVFAYPLLYVLSRVVKDTFNLHWWTYANSFYDTRSAKQVIPLLSTAARFAGIFAGWTMPLLNDLITPNNVIIVWASTFGLIAIIAWLMPRLLRNREAHVEQQVSVASLSEGTSGTSFLQNVREGYRYVVQSPFLRWMAVSTLLLMILFDLLNFHGSHILKAELTTVEDYSAFIGQLTGLTNMIMLPIQLFMLSRIVGWIGMGSANLIFPLGTLGIGAALAFLPGQTTAALAYFSRTTFRTSFRNTVDNLLYNAVPLRVKGRARAFIGGLIVPIASLISSGFLLLLPVMPGASWALPALIVLLALAYFISAIVIRKQYKKALIAMLAQEDYSFLLAPASDLIVTDSETFQLLTKRIQDSTSPDFTIFMAKILSDAGGKDAIPVLIPLARTGDPHVRSAILDILVAEDLRSDEFRQLLVEALADTNGRVRQAAIAGLKQLNNLDQEHLLSLALDLSKDPEIEVRLQVLPILIQSADFFYLASAIQTLTQILGHPDARLRARGVQILGQANDVRFVRNMVEYLNDADDEVRLEAAVAIERLLQGNIPRPIALLVMEHLSKLLSDPVERVRSAALSILGRIDVTESRQILINFLTDSSLQIRETAVEALVLLGKPAIPAVLPALDSPDLRLCKMVAVVLARIDSDKFADLIRNHIYSNLLTIYGNNVRLDALVPCAEHRSIKLLQTMLREQSEQLLAEIFYLLSAIQDTKAVRVISDSLTSENARSRANAIEAIESITSPQIARFVAPLFERSLSPARMLATSKEFSGIESDASLIMRQLISDSDDHWMRSIANFAIGEIGAALYAGKDTQTPIEKSLTRSRKLKSRDFLLESLADKPSEKASTPEVQPKLDNADCEIFTKDEIEAMIAQSAADPVEEVQLAARAASQMLAGSSIMDIVQAKGKVMLSAIEKIIFLKQVPFFEGMTIDQLKILVTVCEEEFFEEDKIIFNQGDLGGALYVVVRGRVGIEREAARKGSSSRIATIEAHSYFGEMSLFDNNPRGERALAIQDTLTLKLRREPVIMLARQYPDLSLRLINVLSQRLREANDRIAQLTPSKPRELQKLYDILE
jgi:HEAT repeat protein/CRP-like cAMP-binding protein